VLDPKLLLGPALFNNLEHARLEQGEELVDLAGALERELPGELKGGGMSADRWPSPESPSRWRLALGSRLLRTRNFTVPRRVSITSALCLAHLV
jgi:hypothetical protein